MAEKYQRFARLAKRLVALAAMLVIAGVGVSLIVDQFEQTAFERNSMLERARHARSPVIEIPIDMTRARGHGGGVEMDFLSDEKARGESGDSDMLGAEDAEGVIGSTVETPSGYAFVLQSRSSRGSGTGGSGQGAAGSPGGPSSGAGLNVSSPNMAVPSAGPIRQAAPTQIARAPSRPATGSAGRAQATRQASQGSQPVAGVSPSSGSTVSTLQTGGVELGAVTQSRQASQQGMAPSQGTVAHGTRPVGSTQSAERVTVTDSDFLLRGQSEDSDYGLYSYLLFTQVDGAAFERNQAALVALFTHSGAVGLSSLNPEKSRKNMTYVPISGTPPEGAGVDWFIDNHDFALSHRILESVNAPSGAGPYLITSLSPLTAGEGRGGMPLLIQDLSWVTPEMVGRWVLAYARDAGRASTWNEARLSELLMAMRTSAMGISAPLGVSIAASAKQHIILR